MKGQGLAGLALMGVGLVAAGAWIAHAGPLNPPAGPVASTYKTLGEIEPRTVINTTNTPGDADSVCRISQPGHYYLTGDLVGQPGKHGIEVEAANVSIDLNGFALRGVAGAISGIDLNGAGPSSPTAAPSGSLKNGVITGWPSNGVTGNNCGGWVIEEVRFHANTGAGISINSGTVFTRCYFTNNSLDGCQTSNHVEFYYCFASQNGGNGFGAGSDSQFVHCEAGSNSGAGFIVPLGGRVVACTSTLNGVGIFVGDGGSVDNCHVDDNRNEGIIVGKGGTVSRCAVDGNGTAGTHAGILARLYTAATVTTATIVDCIVTSNTGAGISSAGGTVRGCMAELNGSTGIAMTGAGVITESTVKANTGAGISGTQSVAIVHCTASSNTLHGIQVFDDCLVRGNTCDSNGTTGVGAGIYIPDAPILTLNSDNRIEENNCSDNDYGIWVADTGNVIIRNTATTNTTANFSIVASNTKGTIVLAAGADIVTSNSWANIEY